MHAATLQSFSEYVCAEIATVTCFERAFVKGIHSLFTKMLHKHGPNLRRLPLIPATGGNVEFSCVSHAADADYSSYCFITVTRVKTTATTYFQKASWPEESLPLSRLLHMCSVLVIKLGICPKAAATWPTVQTE